jgi:hypothetical protein
MTSAYGIDVSTKLAGRIGRCRASMRDAILDSLRNIAVTAGEGVPRTAVTTRKGPPLRFYVYEGYRIFYQLDARTRRVVVLDFGVVPVA